MSYATEHIASTLKAARESKGLSQRDLSKKAGVPQSHISNIENGTVDLRLSSLIALTRALDLELTLVPRKALSAVKSIVRGSERTTGKSGDDSARAASKALNRLQDTIARLTETNSAPKELAQLRRQVYELRHFRIPSSGIEAIRDANQALKEFRNDTKNLDPLRQTLSQIRTLRNTLAHGLVNVARVESARPAYSLDEDDHG